MDLHDVTNDLGGSQSQSAIGIVPADQLRQTEVETIGNQDLDLQYNWQPKLIGINVRGHFADLVNEKAL
ncbi:hypothetical protein E4U10_002034 [Claviceps purpurea]|nr:hypothetical protein E4U10_002034 [Claviceps purpurea]